jgi:hypothetical protein
VTEPGLSRAEQLQQEQAEQALRMAEETTQALTLPLRCSETLGALGAALAKAQSQIAGASRDSVNPHFKSKFASLAAVWDACREALSANEIAVVQPVTTRQRTVIVTTLLIHSSGEWIEERLPLIAQQDTPQGIGSTITYGRRYGLAAMVGVAPADDDGEAGSRTLPSGVKWDKANTPLQQPRDGSVSDELVESPLSERSGRPGGTDPSGSVGGQVPSPGAPLQGSSAGAGASTAPKPLPRPNMGTSAPPPPGMKPPARAPSGTSTTKVQE